MKKFQRFLSLLLAFVLMLSVVPITALATDEEPIAKSEVIASNDIVAITPDATPEDTEDEAVELPDLSVASALAPTLMAGVTVDQEDVQIVAFENELNEVMVLGAEGDPVSLTEEQKQALLCLYQNYVDHRNANADVLGVQVPFFLSFNDDIDCLGVLGEIMSLANIPLDAVRYGYVDYATLEGLMVIFLYTDLLGVQFYGDAIKSARDEALQAIKDSGAKTEAQKLLVLNDWLAERITYDMPYIMGEDKMQAPQPTKHRYYDAVYDVMCDMYEDSIYNVIKTEFVNAIEADMRNKFYIEVVKSMVADGYLSAAAADEQMIAGARQGYQQAVLEQITQAAYDEAYAAYATHEHELAVTWTWAEDLSAATVSAECKTGLESYAAVAAEISTSTTATCTEAGKTTYIATAEIAGITVTDTKEIDTEKLGHDLDENFVCTRCQATIEGHEHKYDTKIAETAPTCTVDGSETYACDCGAEQVKTVVAIGHENETVITKEATCTEEGSLTSTCKKCGEVKTNVIAKKDHAYDAGVVTTPATCTAEGVKTFTCVNCPATKTEAIPKLSHVDETDDLVCDYCGGTMETYPISVDAPELAAVRPGTDADADRYAQSVIKAQEAALAEQAAAVAAAATADDLAPIINTIVYGAEDKDPNKTVETDLEKDAAAYVEQFVKDNEAALNADARAFVVAILTEQLGAKVADGYMVDIDAQCDAFIEYARTNGIEVAPGYKMTIDQIADQQMATTDKIINMGTEKEPYMCTPAEAVALASQQAAAESTVGVLQFWEGSHFGALGEGKAVCLGYADAYSYLVQCMHPEYYTKNGDYKTASNWITDMNQLYYTNGRLDNNKGYYTDLVRITFDTDVTMFGQVEEGFNSDHFWNAARVDGTWYYVDPSHSDAFREVMVHDRAETDGNVDHALFMFSNDSAMNLYNGSWNQLVTLYANAANDSRYEDSWTSRIISDTSYADGYAYYVYSSRDLFSMLNAFGGYDTDHEYKLVRHKLDTSDVGDGDSDFESLIEFNHPSGESTVARVYNPATGAMEEHAFLTALYAQHYADAQVYPALAINTALDGNLLYFNLSNYLLAYNLVSGEIIVVKEYKSVSARRDKTNGFGAMAFSVVGESGGDLTVQNHPIAGIIKKDDGKLYVSIGTNFSYISGKETNDKTHETPEDPGALGEYGYEYEESNYNPNYNTYRSEETNDNDEFMWTANFVETQNMSSVAVKPCSTHTYETVEVAANCEHNAYTVNMCANCGSVEKGTYAEVADTIHNHHYIYFAETYYTKDDQNQNRWNSGECYVCAECGFSIEEPTMPQQNYGAQKEQYEKELAIWNNAVQTAGHEYTVLDPTWSADNKSVTFRKLSCEHCKARKSNLDCLLKDNTIDITLSTPLTAEAVATGFADGNCITGAIVTYTASGRLPQGGSYSISKDVELEPGTHSFEADATWNLVIDAEGKAILDANGNEQYTVDATMICETCGVTYFAVGAAATFVADSSHAPTCESSGQKCYAVTLGNQSVGTVTLTKTVEIPVSGHNYIHEITEVPEMTRSGKLTITCSWCSDAVKVILPSLNTDEYTYEVTQEPTYTEEGIGTYTWKETAYGTVSITVPLDKLAMALKELSVAIEPNKTVYRLGESLDTTGMVLHATYTDGSIKTVTSGYRVSSFDSATAGEKTIIVNYEGRSTTFKVTVLPMTAEDPRIVVSNEKAVVGTTVNVTISLKNNPGVASMMLEVGYDPAVLQLQSVTDAGKLGEIAHSDNYDRNPYILSWVNDLAKEDFVVEGEIVTLTFLVVEDAPVGDTAVTVSYACDNYDIFNAAGENVWFATVDGSVEVVDALLGDVNSDGKVNAYDRAYLARYLAKWTDYPASVINMDAADVNGDGAVNAHDRVYLARHLAKWTGYETLG